MIADTSCRCHLMLLAREVPNPNGISKLEVVEVVYVVLVLVHAHC